MKFSVLFLRTYYRKTVLYTNTSTSSFDSTVTLSDSLANYDAMELTAHRVSDNVSFYAVAPHIPDFVTSSQWLLTAYRTSSGLYDVRASGTGSYTTLHLAQSYPNQIRIDNVIGIKKVTSRRGDITEHNYSITKTLSTWSWTTFTQTIDTGAPVKYAFIKTFNSSTATTTGEPRQQKASVSYNENNITITVQIYNGNGAVSDTVSGVIVAIH